jgi:hypothetical protein
MEDAEIRVIMQHDEGYGQASGAAGLQRLKAVEVTACMGGGVDTGHRGVKAALPE